MAMDVRSRVRGFGIGLIVYAGFMVYNNPIHFHQTAHAGGLTMHVPVTWTPMKSSYNIVSVSLRREWFPFLPSGSVMLMDESVYDLGGGGRTWTMEAARNMQAGLVAARSKVVDFSHTSTFDLKAGDHTAVCTESMLRGSRVLNCNVVGTPLLFDFMGSRFAEPDAERMLASLN